MGCYDERGPGPLHICKKGDKINASSFALYIRNEMLPFFEQRNKCCGLFDNAKPHKGAAFPEAHINCHALVDNAKPHKGCAQAVFTELGIMASDHPPNSPDMNPIELVWQRMAYMVNSNLPWETGFTYERFEREIQRAWLACATRDLFLKDMKHVASILKKVEENKGGNMFE